MPERNGAEEAPVGFDDPALEAAFGLDTPSDWISRARESQRPAPCPGRLGPYELLEEIGRGGQGVVYKAVQPGTRRPVAIKCFPTPALKPGKRDRFEQETRALVRLNHPSVVTVHGAEIVDGSPILLMEHITGNPIDEWSDAGPPESGRRPRSEVLGAFVLVCEAVSHAHQRGVIHRDLKPSNVLVDEAGVPRVLDFGIARLVDDLQSGAGATMTGFAGTPSYASPEQLEGSETDTRTDVYSLGVLLYRILAGSEPFPRDLGLSALINAVRGGQVRRPSAVCPSLPRELDWVVLKAMNPDPAQRYQTVDALATDLRLFLKGEPVLAHPPSTAYVVAKFVRKHRGACASACAAAAVILVLTGVSVAQTIRVSRQNSDLVRAVEREALARGAADADRARADAQAESQREMTRAIGNIVTRIATRASRVATLTRKELFGIIDPELARLTEPKDPAGRLQFYVLCGQVATSAGRLEDALAHATSAITAAAELDVLDDATRSGLHVDRGDLLKRLGRFSEALDEAALAMDTKDPALRFRAQTLIYATHFFSGDLKSARATLSQILAEAGEDHSLRAGALEHLSFFEMALGQPHEASLHLAETLAELKAAGREGSLDTTRLRVHLASLLLNEGKAEEAERLADAAVKVRLRSNGSMHIRTQEALLTHAEALSHLGRFAEAAQRLEQAHARHETAYGKDSKRLACHRLRLAAAYLGAGAADDGRRNLALAVSLGTCTEPDHAKVEADVKRCELALAANGWLVDQRLADSLGPLAWLVEGAAKPLTEPPQPDEAVTLDQSPDR
ncbi:eukaryotic-like serine/threonine-protein kinase [Phycisphaerales bacterium]|nr:eukaryotic-like serine/threonine-protein kinase [Phycisphaerales bacterium]